LHVAELSVIWVQVNSRRNEDLTQDGRHFPLIFRKKLNLHKRNSAGMQSN
jgi:hypothetical protein